MLITSVNNEKIKNIVKLQDKKTRDELNLFIVEGDHLVNEAIKHNLVKEIYSLETNNNYKDATFVSNSVMKKISLNKSVPDVIAVVNKPSMDVIHGNVLILDGIQDPGNLGTIIRSSVAFNIGTIILSNNCVDLYNDKVIRSTEGNIFNINIIREDLNKMISFLKENDYTIIGTKVTDGVDICEMKTSKYALIMGNEGLGVSKKILDLCDEYAYIKMNSNVESLNVAVATSILLYELDKR